MRHWFVACASVLVAACGGSSSGTPGTPTNPGPPSSTQALSGRVTDILTGSGVAGATVNIGGAQVTTSGDGSWRADVSPPSTERLTTTVTASGYHRRDTYLAWTSGARQDIVVDLLPARAPFDLTFYRELVRDGLENRSRLEPLRRWTGNPNVYLRTLNPKTGAPLTPGEVQTVLQSVRDAVSQLTGGLLQVGTMESGVAARPERTGTINIDIVYEPDEDYCGLTFVGANPGSVQFNYGACSTPCSGLALGPELIAHEIGHALGFWHVKSGVMQATRFVNCTTIAFTEMERLHGSIAYRRPSGNLDIDRDPQSFTALTPPGGAPVIRCARKAASRPES